MSLISGFRLKIVQTAVFNRENGGFFIIFCRRPRDRGRIAGKEVEVSRVQ